MRQLMLAALHSGAGKTVVTCALLTVLRRRGMQVRAFKCGPDYIDPMFHSRVLGVPSRNIDLFLQGKAGVRAAFKAADGDIAIVEGAMGFYDGVAGTEIASAWAVAEAADIPVVLVLRPQGAALTLAAQLCGIQQFRPRSHIAGVLLNDCKASLSEYLSPILQRETGLPVLGYLPHCAEAELPSRHLGLWTPEEISNLRERNETLATRMEESVDIQTLLSLANGAPRDTNLSSVSAVVPRCRIAVARDEAFCFYYEDNLDALRMNGAELVFFSPMRDAALPVNCGGVYLGGGYPELYLPELSANERMRTELCLAVLRGMPTVAECGGFLYLQSAMRAEDGRRWEMVGVFPGEGFPTGGLRRFGYLTLTAETDSLLFKKGECCPAHEFHYWDCNANGKDFSAKKWNGSPWRCGFAGPKLYAAFSHLHFGGGLPLARRFVDAAAEYAARGVRKGCCAT